MCRTSLSHLQTWPVSCTGLPGHTEVDCSVVSFLLLSTNLKVLCDVCICVFLTSNKLTPTDLCLASVCSVPSQSSGTQCCVASGGTGFLRFPEGGSGIDAVLRRAHSARTSCPGSAKHLCSVCLVMGTAACSFTSHRYPRALGFV